MSISMNGTKSMELGCENNKEEDRAQSSLRLETSELESKLKAEKQRFVLLQSELELSKLILSQEVDKYRRECMCLKETVARLEEDCNILREREARDQERIRNLLEKIEKSEREFTNKLIELKMGQWDFEYAKKQAHDEVHTQVNSNKISRSKKKFKFDSRWTSIASIPGSFGNNDVSDKDVRTHPTGYIKNQSSRRLHNRRNTSSERLLRTLKRAEALQSNLKSSNPSFIKSMVPSSVSGGFSLHIPRNFSKENLPAHEVMMILEDEKGLEYKAKYIVNHSMLSGGWIGFATAHNLGVGDTLIFELSEPARFKVYVLKAIPELSNNFKDKMVWEYTEGTSKWADTNRIDNQDVDLSVFNENLQKMNMLIKLEDEQA